MVGRKAGFKVANFFAACKYQQISHSNFSNARYLNQSSQINIDECKLNFLEKDFDEGIKVSRFQTNVFVYRER